MKKSICVLFFVLLSFTVSAQEHGTIYSASDAENQFGSVEFATEISADTFNSIIQNNPGTLLFQLVEENVYIFDESKSVVFGGNQSVEGIAKYYVYSVSKIEELLNLGESETIFLEKRGEYLTISSGDYTLEDAAWCPPFCQ